MYLLHSLFLIYKDMIKVYPSLHSFFSQNYSSILKSATTYNKGKQNTLELVHFVIDYFYFNSDREKVEQLLATGTMENYFFRTLRMNINSKTAPYYRKNQKHREIEIHSNYEEPSENENYINKSDIEDNEYDLETDYLISYKYNIVMRLLDTEYVMNKFISREHWEYSKRIFLWNINENMTLNDINKKTNISRQTIEYNYKKIRSVIINILKDRELLESLIPDVDIYKIEESIDSKKTEKFYMDYFTILSEFQQNCKGVKPTLLKKAASQKAKYLSAGTPREKAMIAVDIINHYVKSANIISDRRIAQERVNLYAEYISPNPNPYKSTGCSSCMEAITRAIRNIMLNHRLELYENNV